MFKVILILMMMMLLLISRARAMSNSIAIQSPPNQIQTPPIHIFLSFRGDDTREDLTSCLYKALVREGFNVFMDKKSIRPGHPIDTVIEKAIKDSMGAVIIFSHNFTSSEWCLDELVQIVERKKKLGSRYVLQPIYAKGVRPTHIQELTGIFGEAFSVHNKCKRSWDWKRNKRVNRWRAALKQVGGYKGKVLQGDWGEFIEEVVKEIEREFHDLRVKVNSQPYLKKKTELLEPKRDYIIESFYEEIDLAPHYYPYSIAR